MRADGQPPEPVSDASVDVYGLLTIAGVEVALALSSLREVVPCPERFTVLPTRAAGLLGTMEVRELVVPVLDLAPRMGWQTGHDDHRVVVVLSDGVRLLGVLAERLRHVQQVPAARLLAVHQDGGEVLVTHTFRDTTSGGIVSVLDVAAILALTGVPTIDVPVAAPPARAADAEPSTPGHEGAGGSRRGLTLVQCGPYALALDVHQVHTTLPACDATPSVLDSDLCRGTMAYTGREVAVVDPLVLLGLGRLPQDTTGPGLVLDLGAGYVVLALTALLDIVDVAEHEITPLPAFTVRRPALFDGVLIGGGDRPSMVLDGGTLLADAALLALAHLNVERAGGPAAAATPVDDGAGSGPEVQGAPGLGEPHLRYAAGVDVVTPLAQVSQILPFPRDLTPTHVAPFLLGTITHRGAVVPVLCLPTLLGLTPVGDHAGRCLLVVDVDGQRVAHAVDALQGLEPLIWRDDEDPGAAAGACATPTLRTSPLVQVGGDTRLLPQLDLLAVTRTVVRGGAHDDLNPGVAALDDLYALAEVPG